MPAGKGVDVPSIATAVMDALVLHYAATSPPVALPDRRVIVGGDIRVMAWDCASVLVTCAGVQWGSETGLAGPLNLPTGQPLSSGGTRRVAITVQIVRCISDSDAEPAAAEVVTAEGLLHMRDAGLLSQALVDLVASGVLRRHGVAIAGDVTPVGPAGAYAAVEGTLIVTAGYLV